MKWLAHTWYIVLVNKNWLNRERAMLVYWLKVWLNVVYLLIKLDDAVELYIVSVAVASYPMLHYFLNMTFVYQLVLYL